MIFTSIMADCEKNLVGANTLARKMTPQDCKGVQRKSAPFLEEGF